MEATYQIIILRPYFANIGKRLVKTPKIYFADVGTLCHLVGLRDPAHAATGPMGGAILETAVISEIFKAYLHRGVQPQIYFWRTSSGDEVDVVIEHESKLIPVEVKLSSTPFPKMAKGIVALRKDLGSKIERGYVVHMGNTIASLGDSTIAIPFSAL